jgi:hypothetical protein
MITVRRPWVGHSGKVKNPERRILRPHSESLKKTFILRLDLLYSMVEVLNNLNILNMTTTAFFLTSFNLSPPRGHDTLLIVNLVLLQTVASIP